MSEGGVEAKGGEVRRYAATLHMEPGFPVRQVVLAGDYEAVVAERDHWEEVAQTAIALSLKAMDCVGYSKGR